MPSLMQDITNYFNERKQKFNFPSDVEIKFVEKNGKKEVEIYNSKKKLLTKSKYSIIGLYNATNSVWFWGWFLDFADRNLVDNTTQIKDWGKKMLKKTKPTSKHDQAIYFYTKNGSFMTSSMNVSFFAKLAMYVLKGKYYFPVTHSEEGTNSVKEYIMIY